MIKKIFLSIILLGLFSGITFSQVTKNEGPLIESISFEQTELKDAIDMISSTWGIDIIYDEEIKGKVAPPIKLTNVSCEKALKIILDLSGFAYEWEENLIRVKKKSKALTAAVDEKVITQIYIFKNAKAEEVEKSSSLKELLTGSGKITVDQKLNALSITDIESNVNRVVIFIKRLDEGEKITKVVPLNFAKAADVVSSGILQKLLSEKGKIKTDARTNSLVITDGEANIKEIEEFVKKIDLPTPQVMIEATILETNSNYTKDLGIDWQFQKKLGKGISGISYDAHMALGAGAATGGIFQLGTLAADQFATIIEALETKTDTKILSNPRIATINNQEAIIKVGKSTPVLITTASEGVAFQSVQYIDTGVTLTVTPQITPDDNVTLKIHPVVSDSLGIGPGGAPILATSEATTTVLVKSGQTVVIGGLLKETKPVTTTKVPILGDIPIIGWLFRKKTTGTGEEKRDLMIFITPRVVKQLENPPKD